MEPEPDVSGSAAGLSKSRRRQTGVRALIVLVICCGILFWAVRVPLGEPAPGDCRGRSP